MARAAEFEPIPVIGLTTGPVTNGNFPDSHFEGDHLTQAQTNFYIEAIRAAGATVFMVPYMNYPDDAMQQRLYLAGIDRLDGLILAGGNDVDPERSDRELIAGVTEEVSLKRDSSEFLAVERAKRISLPVLAICRGMHVLNVAHGGTLHQHVPKDVGVKVTHLHPHGDAGHRHPVSLIRSTRTGAMLLPHDRQATINVGSSHHQGIDRVGDGLVVAARADDDLVEAVETADGRMRGVQWHPEHTGPSVLFDWLVAEAHKPRQSVSLAA